MPDNPSAPERTAVPLYAQYRERPNEWSFQGTAFFINSTQLLTARHVVDGYQEKKDGSLTFPANLRDQSSHWAIGFGTEGGVATPRRVRVVQRPSNLTLDAILLELMEVFEGVTTSPRPVTWLTGITRPAWKHRHLGQQDVRVDGFPKDYIAPRPNGADSTQTPVMTGFEEGESLMIRDQDGLLSGRLRGGGLHAGTSGSPVLLESAYGDFCVGLAKLGSERSGPANFLGEGSILPWLREHKIQFFSQNLNDLPPEDLADYLVQVRQSTRTLLIPILGSSGSHLEEPGSQWQTDESEAKFIELFICLHARPAGETMGDSLRQQEIEILYEEVRSSWKGEPLKAWSQASHESSESNSARMLKVVQTAIGHCASANRKKDKADASFTGWESFWLKECCRHLNARIDAGERRLVDRPHVWNALQASPWVILTSPAGGGKSTVAMFLALALAHPAGWSAEHKLSELLSAATDLRGRIPVFLRFRSLPSVNLQVKDPSAQRRAIETLLTADLDPAIALLVKRECAAGRALLIFDGLDELAEELRPAWSRCLQAWLTDGRCGNRVLVTSRPTAYPPADASVQPPTWSLDSFALWQLEKLDPWHQREFLENWFGQTSKSEAPNIAREVFSEIRDRELEELSEDPLLLAGLARLATERRSGQAPRPLPDTKVEVFEEVIELILTRWEAARAGQTHSELAIQLEHWRLTSQELRSVLSHLALLSLSGSGSGDFTRESLVKKLEMRITRKANPPGPPKDGAEHIVRTLTQRSGLVRPLESGPAHRRVSCFEFPVRSYRNFLAGEALFTGLQAPIKDPPEFAVSCLCDGLASILEMQPGDPPVDAIHQAQTLELGLARHVAIERYPVGEYLRAFVERAKLLRSRRQAAFPALRAAALLAREVKEWRLDSTPGPRRWLVRSDDSLHAWREILPDVVASPFEASSDRVAAASLSGLLSAPPDRSRPPKIDWRLVGDNQRLRFLRGDHQTWGGGQAAMCDLVPRPFYMSRYPVTVDDFETYVRAKSAPRPASFEGQHRLWRVPVYEIPNHPVVGVDWNSAVTYCAWLTEELHLGRLSVPPPVEPDRTSWEVRLPEEWEWELSARGPVVEEPPPPEGDWLRVPWGWATLDQIRSRANCDWIQQGTTAVNAFSEAADPSGNVSRFGVADLVGNVWEWCQTPWIAEGNGVYPVDYDQRVTSAQDSKSLLRVVRGGCWGSAPRRCRCARRRALHPDSRLNGLGFRPVLALVPSGASGARVPRRSDPNAVDAGDGRAEGSEDSDA